MAITSHSNGLMATLCGAAIVNARAASPIVGSIRPIPPRLIRAKTLAFRAAMPTAAHAPHCTLDTGAPVARSIAEIRSSTAFAAA